MRIIAAFSIVMALSGHAAPRVTGGVRNAASQIHLTAANGGIAQGSRFLITGKELGPAEAATQEGYPLVTELGGVSIEVTVDGTKVSAWVLSASAHRVMAMLPSKTPTGTGTVTLRYGGGSVSTPIRVVARGLGIYTNGVSPAGPATAKASDGAAIRITAPARAGQRVTIRANGLGATEGDEAAGPAVKDFEASEVEARLGGMMAKVLSAKRTETAGVDEITIEIPDALSSASCFVPLAFKAAGVWTNYTSLPIAEGSNKNCSSTLLSGAGLDNLSVEGGEAKIGTITLDRSAIAAEGGEFVTDVASGAFEKYTYSGINSYTGSNSDLPFGSCTVLFPFTAEDEDEDEIAEFENPATPLHAGRLRLTGPKGNKDLGVVKGSFHVELGKGISIVLPPGTPPLPIPSDLYLDPGNYTLTGEGGDDVGPFSMQIAFNPAQWSNPNVAASINRSADLRMTWTGGGANDTVMAVGGSSAGQSSAFFVCIARGGAGQITVPAYVLEALPASQGEGGILGLLSQSEGKTFTARGLDSGILSVSRKSLRQARYR